MPLSEDEKRILRQIEQDLQQDPEFSRHGYRISRRRLVMLIAALVVGVALTVFLLTVNYLLSFVAFLGVFAVAILLESEIRIIGRERLGALPISAWLGAGRRVGQRPGPKRGPGPGDE